MANEKLRWQMRFENFHKAYCRLREGMAEKPLEQMSMLEKEGLIQRFEYTVELAWKTVRDYLENQNVVFEQITPRAVIKEAFAAKVITDGDTWMAILDARNKMSHTYDIVVFEQVLFKIRESYLEALAHLHDRLAHAINP